ncbi:NAD(P)H-binding protein [Levilactobacillus bambusae]|uniref:Short-chain dehydrogenase n=1 Tax=Levilactobacillus bambusae TaxID=2024736 RepID=A0A2V1MZ30_9LACO|nr:NAD(P)H-binding protein [Levilactobacillus bambusae]PWG00217.1 short-chain dehydrogenase [Levilactobacillus bambusae]
MKIFVIGAHGQVGQLLTQKLAHLGNDVYAGIRKADEAGTIEKLGGIPVQFDLMGSIQQMATTIAGTGAQAIIFTAGSGGSTDGDATLNIDLDGAVRSMEAAELDGIKRYLIVSAMGTDDREFWEKSGIRSYYVAKYYADQWLMHRTDLEYTILRPGILTNDAPTDKIEVDPAPDADKHVTRSDVASVAAAALNDPNTIGKIITFANGNVPISELI